MNFDELRKLARAQLDELAEIVIGEFKTLDIEECGQAPDDLGFLTMWDEFKEQLISGNSFSIELYEDTFHRFTRRELEKESENELTFLWGVTDAAIWFDWEDRDLCQDELCVGITKEIYSCICEKAGSEEIEYRPGYGPDGEEDSEEDDDEEEYAPEAQNGVDDEEEYAPEAQNGVSEAKAEVPEMPTDIPDVEVEVPEAKAEISNGQMSLFGDD